MLDEGDESGGGQPNLDSPNITPDPPQSTSFVTPKSRRLFSKFTSAEKEMDDLTEEIRKLDELLEELEEDRSTTTEKQILQRDIRHKKVIYTRNLSEMLIEKHQRKY